MQRARRWTLVLLWVLMATSASALEVPTDAEVLVTDASSRIVGVGRVADGASFDLVLVDGFAGPAVLVWLAPDGGVRTVEVEVADGAVWVDGDALTSLLPASFVEVRVRLATELGEAWPPAVGRGPPADVPPSGSGEGRGPPAVVDPPGPPDAPPGPPSDAGPPETPPGPPEDPPGRR